jgi:hypothetical protein
MTTPFDHLNFKWSVPILRCCHAYRHSAMHNSYLCREGAASARRELMSGRLGGVRESEARWRE